MFCTHCAAEVLSIATNFCYSCGKELNIKADEPKSEMSDDSSAVSANDLITEMFHRGYPHNVIVHLLVKNSYKMHLTLKRRLIDLRLKRKEKQKWTNPRLNQKRNRRCRKTCRLQKYLACLAFKTPCACPSFFGCQSCCCCCKI